MRELLVEYGPTRPEELSRLLAGDGYRLDAATVVARAAKYADQFATAPAGEVTLAGHATTAGQDADANSIAETDSESGASQPWWDQITRPQRVGREQVVVVDIETTGLDPAADRIWEIAAVNLGTGVMWSTRCRHEGEHPRVPPVAPGEAVVDVAAALNGLAAFLTAEDARIVAGHNIGFDVDFLAKAIAEHGLDITIPPTLDLLETSVLADPGLVNRTLADLCERWGVEQHTPHRAAPDAVATAAVLSRVLDEIDPDDASWATALACLHAGDHALAALVPLTMPADVAAAFASVAPMADPLVAPARDGAAATTAREATIAGFRALESAGLSRRSSQHEMALAVADRLDGGGRLAVEAPTGTGKSYAYLLPAAAAAGPDRPVVVATHTKVLQQQLHDDATRLRALGLHPAPFRQIRGVANYLCTREIHERVVAGCDREPEWLALAVGVRALAAAPGGTWDAVTDYVLGERSRDYRALRATLRTDAQGCERTRCAHAPTCPLFTRLQGIEVDPGVVAVNHAVLAAWTAETAGAPGDADSPRAPGDVLGEGTTLIIDEAHDLEDSLTGGWTLTLTETDLDALGRSVEGRFGVIRVVRQVEARAGAAVGGRRRLQEAARVLADESDGFGREVLRYLHEFGGHDAQAVLARGVVWHRPEFGDLRSRARSLRAAVTGLRAALYDVAQEVRELPGGRTAAFRAATLAARVDAHIVSLGALDALDDEHRVVHLLRGGAAEGWGYERIPVQIGARFAATVVDAVRATVLTSATLTVAGSFAFVGRRLGLEIADDGGDADSPVDPAAFGVLRLASPFDHATQAELILAGHMPAPTPSNEREFCEEFAADQVGLLSLTGGRMLTLFAARHRMELVAAHVDTQADALAERGVQVLVQGRESPNTIAREFRATTSTAALGLRSFWEGFDAPGDTLQYLVIEKPPYPHPHDPLTVARQNRITAEGGDPFLDYVLPRTAIALAQGFGRLIRSETDRGVVIFTDRRMRLPSTANATLLDTLPATTHYYAEDRADAWTEAVRFVTGTVPDLSTALQVSFDTVASLLAELRLVPGEDPDAKLVRAAREIFGIAALRPEQLEIMRAVLAGRDVLGMLPTGFGKSLCFQLPALLRAEDRPTVVISPLLALIKDQVDGLRGRYGLRSVHGIVGQTTQNERTAIMQDLVGGKVRLLYIAPERLINDGVLRQALASRRLGALVVDEAHCISAWGFDFRPDYRTLPKLTRDFDPMSRVGLTATASEEVEEDITAQMGLAKPAVVKASADRPNLRYWVQRCQTNADRDRELLRVLEALKPAHGIVYAWRRSTTEEVAAMLRNCGYTARHYHAGMPPEQRDAVQEDFMAGSTQVIVATKAFGMGVDKPDIGWVVHYDLPDSLESYAQEAGRAGRDPTLSAACVLLYTGGDLKARQRQVSTLDVEADLRIAQRLMREIATWPTRNGDHVFDPDEMAAAVGVEPDDLGVHIAWMERAGALDRLPNCAQRGMVEGSHRVPPDAGDARRYREVVWSWIDAKPGTSRRITLDEVASAHGADADELEHDLNRWTLEGLVRYRPTAKLWRVATAGRSLDEARYREQVRKWNAWERRRFDALDRYVAARTCRRVLLTRAFGPASAACGDTEHACDVCSGTAPFWHDVPIARVPDPEDLVDVEHTILMAVLWTSRFKDGAYGEKGLLAALCGNEFLGAGRRLGTGLLNCPHFGALRHVRSKEKRVDAALRRLVETGLVARDTAEMAGRAPYTTLRLTELGSRHLA